MTASDAEPPDKLAAIRDIAATAALAGAGAITGTPAGAMFFAALPPALRFALDLDRADFARRGDRAATTLSRAAEVGGLDLEDLAARAETEPTMSELLARVIRVSADARMNEKVTGLGNVLGRAILDDAKFDEAFLLADALNDLEAPHFRVLGLLNGAQDCTWFPAGRNRVGTLERFEEPAGGNLVFSAVKSALVRHGLIETVGEETIQSVNRRAQQRAEPNVAESPPVLADLWRTTALGRECLMLVLPEPPPWALPDGSRIRTP